MGGEGSDDVNAEENSQEQEEEGDDFENAEKLIEEARSVITSRITALFRSLRDFGASNEAFMRGIHKGISVLL